MQYVVLSTPAHEMEWRGVSHVQLQYLLSVLQAYRMQVGHRLGHLQRRGQQGQQPWPVLHPTAAAEHTMTHRTQQRACKCVK